MYFVQIVPVQMVYVQIVHMCFQHSRCISTGMENKNDLQLMNMVELDVDWQIGFAKNFSDKFYLSLTYNLFTV